MLPSESSHIAGLMETGQDLSCKILMNEYQTVYIQSPVVFIDIE